MRRLNFTRTNVVRRACASRSENNLDMSMKRQNENSRPFDQIILGVTRIIFGDDNLSEMNIRLTRIALEHYGVPEILDPPAGGNTRGNGSHSDDADALDQIAVEVAHLIFGDNDLTEMNVRLARLALEHYGIQELVNLPADASRRDNGARTGAATTAG